MSEQNDKCASPAALTESEYERGFRHGKVAGYDDRVAEERAASPAALTDATRLPERVIDTLISEAGVSTFHPDGDQLGKLHEFAQGVANEVLARIPRALLAASPADQDARDAARYRALRKSGDVSISCDHGDYTQYVESGEELDDLCDNYLSASKEK